MSKLEIKNLNMGYKKKVLDDLNLELDKGQICLLYTSPSPRD